MKIRASNNIGGASRYDAAAAEETLRELDEQYARGEIERHAYFEKKRSLVRLFLKATTSPQRKPRGDFDY
ncbi:hypothetical protein [Leucobacter komagatae]|uniref:Uncharacterized protein n=1 Tax=Leucobacter komagatae TaxID=55969 RepID=A0A0D0I0T9_9MICO|nr:hypothetical protein [Leucobacter komagatae]KIP53386.1 hypothetical protein SD72_03975 [Leucobacter komagatae]